MAELTLKRVRVYLISVNFFRFSSSERQYDQYLFFKLESLLSYLLICFLINHAMLVFSFFSDRLPHKGEVNQQIIFTKPLESCILWYLELSSAS